MKKILFFAFGVWISIVSFGQGQAVKDSLQAIVGDSIGNSLQQISSSLEDATKAEGDSAYMKNDYASAIQIYEALLNRGRQLIYIIILEIVIIRLVILLKLY